MFRSLRRVFVWGCKHGFTILAVFLVVGYGTTFLKPRPAQADEAVDLLKSVALSDLAMEDRLMALEELKGKGSSSARTALVEIAGKADLPVAMAAVALARERWKTGAVALGAFSLHLLGDLVGSDWAIAPLYPISGATLSPQGVLSPEVIYGIIDPVVAVAALAVAGLIMYFREVSPVEFVSVRLDKWFVGRFVFPLKHRCGLCARRALARCGSCGRGVCARHLRGFLRTRCTECPAVPGRD